MEQTYKFNAFISYSHRDIKAGILSEELRKKLDVSKFLIVICLE